MEKKGIIIRIVALIVGVILLALAVRSRRRDRKDGEEA